MEVSIFKEKKQFTTSYFHPLRKKRIRENFLDEDKALERKKEIAEKFSSLNITSFDSLNIEELLIHFLQTSPKSSLFSLNLHLADFMGIFGDQKIEVLDSKILNGWFSLVQRETGMKDVSLKVLKMELGAFFRFLKQKGIISISPMEGKVLNLKSAMTDSDIRELLEALKEYSPGYLYPLVKLVEETGAIEHEIRHLTYKQLDLKNAKVSFKNESGKNRSFDLSPELTQIFKIQEKHGGRVFLNFQGKPMGKVFLEHVISEFKQRGSYQKDWTLGGIRHFFAMRFLEQTKDSQKLCSVLGISLLETKLLYGSDDENSQGAQNE